MKMRTTRHMMSSVRWQSCFLPLRTPKWRSGKRLPGETVNVCRQACTLARSSICVQVCMHVCVCFDSICPLVYTHRHEHSHIAPPPSPRQPSHTHTLYFSLCLFLSVLLHTFLSLFFLLSLCLPVYHSLALFLSPTSVSLLLCLCFSLSFLPSLVHFVWLCAPLIYVHVPSVHLHWILTCCLLVIAHSDEFLVLVNHKSERTESFTS